MINKSPNKGSENIYIHHYVMGRNPQVGIAKPSVYGSTPYTRTLWQVTLTHHRDPKLVNVFTILASTTQSAVSQLDLWIRRNIGDDFPPPTTKDYAFTFVPLVENLVTLNIGVVSFCYVW